MYSLLKEDIAGLNAPVGRDKFFGVLRSAGLLVRRKRNHIRTTQSYHRFRVYKNQLKARVISKINEAWVSDITYIRSNEGFLYLSLVTDVYSRKIVGWSLTRSLQIEGAMKALKMALRQRCGTKELIHHSDRGIQYCSKDYVDLLHKNKIGISMTEENHCYENAIAERVNGILKQEYNMEGGFKTYRQAVKGCAQGIYLYNEERPHLSLAMKTPNQLHKVA